MRTKRFKCQLMGYPLEPEDPDEPLVPDDPLEPEDPEDPLEPEVPEEPLVPDGSTGEYYFF